ncbi:MAG: TonB-dependent receptor [Bacteroidales bacterium]|nr:TonB-dependent receptor [Bacteroidales bacterium]MDD3010610.1 TonB-dependent receptor [Bacteroidales bacterium]MDD3961426.1 TonB-dependent receptor [Bacteroidales bacterium]MDY0286065.1 TonB-dependent receptor [Bacteroidales bacterium]HPE86527.1 TonB-dependent receptor [Bacteroidales bacterium]
MRRMLLSFVVVILPLLVNAQFANGTAVDLQPVEIIASRNFLPEEAGMKTSRVDTLIIMDKINLSLSELLAENTPVFIKNNGRGALSTASFRGTSAAHTQVLWNGIPVNTPMAGMVDFSLVPVYVIDAVELKHGASGIADYSGGFGGVIQINNFVDWNQRPEVKYLQGLGSFGTHNEYLSVKAGTATFRSHTRLYHTYSCNDFPFINRKIGIIDSITGAIINPSDTNHNADYRIAGVLQEFYMKAGKHDIVSLRYWGQGAQRAIPRITSYEGPEGVGQSRQQDIDHKGVMEWNHYGSVSLLRVRTGISHKTLNYSLVNTIAGTGAYPAVSSHSFVKSLFNGLYYSRSLPKGFKLKGAFDWNIHQVVTEDTVTKTGYSKLRHEQSLFLSAYKSFAGRLNLNFMTRLERVDGKLLPVIPFVGFDYRVLPEQTLLIKGHIARNYHQPTLNDLFWVPGGNPDLRPEHGIAGELGMEMAWASGDVKLHLEGSAFYNDITDWIIWLPDFKGYWEPQNIARVVSKGVELSFSGSLLLGSVGINTVANYAFTRAINYGDPVAWGDDAYGKQLAFIPRHSGNAMFKVTFRSFSVTYQHNSFSERYTTSSNDRIQRDWLYPYFMNDLLLGKRFVFPRFSIDAEVKIYNLFNETYHTVLFTPMPKRNYLLQIMITL